MRQTLVSTSILLLLVFLFIAFGNINCSDEQSISPTTQNTHQKKGPTLYKTPDKNTPMNVAIQNPNYTERGIHCKMEICHCCLDSGRYYEAYNVVGGPAIASWYTDGKSQCLTNLVNTIKGESYVVYEFNSLCAEDELSLPTYFTACTCGTEEDRDTIKCCTESP